MRDLVRETQVSTDDLAWPLFVVENDAALAPIASMTGTGSQDLRQQGEESSSTPGEPRSP